MRKVHVLNMHMHLSSGAIDVQIFGLNVLFLYFVYVSAAVADPAFLKRGFICIKGWGFALLDLSHFSEISHENEIQSTLFITTLFVLSFL